MSTNSAKQKLERISRDPGRSTPYQLRVGVLLGDVGMLLIDFREVLVDGQREQRVAVASHEVHLDLLTDVELLPGDGDDAEKGIMSSNKPVHTLCSKMIVPKKR